MKKCFKKLSILFICFVLLLPSISVSAASKTESGEQTKKVKVGWYISEHFQEEDAPGNQKSGYSYEYLQAVANYTGWEYEYVSGSWSELYDAFLNGEIDVLPGVSFTEERASLMNFPNYRMGSESYYVYKSAEDESINSADLTTLNGKRIGTLRNNLMTDYFEQWASKNGINCEEVLFDDFQSRDEAFFNGKIDALIAVNNNVPANYGLTPMTMIGESTYYLAVTKDRMDLLADLNQALASIKESNPYFIQSLQVKYFNYTAVNATLSQSENAWLDSHDSIRVGYLDDYMPYCSMGMKREALGLMPDIIGMWQEQLKLSNRIDFEFQPYASYDEMIAALQTGEVDVAFPIYDCIWDSEEKGIVQTGNLIETGAQLIYRGEYREGETTNVIAISKQSAFQKNYVMVNYPDSEVYVADSVEDCLKAVKSKKATCTILDYGQAERVLAKRKFRSLNRLSLGEEINYCMGVKKGNNELYSLLSRGILLIDDSELGQNVYNYIGANRKYTIVDFVEDHTAFVSIVLMLIFSLIIATNYAHYKAHIDPLTGLESKMAYTETVKQIQGRINEDRANFVVAIFDLNGLKTINDTYGHEMGDMALCDAGSLLKKVFGAYHIYRFGGDEFIVIKNNTTLEEVREAFKVLDMELEKFNETEHPYMTPLAIAKGAAEFYPREDEEYLSTFKRADRAMYMDKNKYYEMHGGKQRR